MFLDLVNGVRVHHSAAGHIEWGDAVPSAPEAALGSVAVEATELHADEPPVDRPPAPVTDARDETQDGARDEPRAQESMVGPHGS